MYCRWAVLHLKASPAACTAEKRQRCASILEKLLDEGTASGKCAPSASAARTQKLSLFLAVIQFDPKSWSSSLAQSRTAKELQAFRAH